MQDANPTVANAAQEKEKVLAEEELMAAGGKIEGGDEAAKTYPVGFKLATVVASLMLAVLCVALDNTIIATAIPRITDEFNSLDNVGWYGSAYLLTTCAFQLFYGKLYTFFNAKLIFLIALFIFELGSLICGVAPNSVALIVGRAIAGLGSSGIFTGALVTIAHIVPFHRRPLFLGLIGGIYGIASVVGPLMGGAFTDHVSWRWCFYINLPIGALTAVGLVFFLRMPPTAKRLEGVSLGSRIMQFDPIGTALFVPAIVCLLLALQWGGITYPWSSGRIIALFVLFAVLLIAFIATQIWLGERATIPPRIAMQRSVAFAAFFGLCIGASFFIFIYFLPIWFQAIRGASAVQSGSDNLPMLLAQVIAIVVSGGLTTKIGYYMPFVVLSPILTSIGAGLLTTFTVDTSTAQWIGYQIIYGFGCGCGFQQGAIAAQACLELADVPIGTAFILFIQFLGGALFISVGQNVFTNKLVERIVPLNIPHLEPKVIVQTGATALRNIIPPDFLPGVLVAYNEAITKTFQVSLILACMSVLGAAGMEWKSVKGKQLSAAAA